jgi:hypothetical protein
MYIPDFDCADFDCADFVASQETITEDEREELIVKEHGSRNALEAKVAAEEIK